MSVSSEIAVLKLRPLTRVGVVAAFKECQLKCIDGGVTSTMVASLRIIISPSCHVDRRGSLKQRRFNASHHRFELCLWPCLKVALYSIVFHILNRGVPQDR